MSKVAELAYDIEQLYIEGYSPKSISVMLNCPLEQIYNWLEAEGLAGSDSDELSPFATMNS
jgi:Putative ATPase subunit of terminase (gpP-like)